MQTNLSPQIIEKLTHLRESIQRDSQTLQSYPDGKLIFDELFDAIQSTLQNTVDSSADRPE